MLNQLYGYATIKLVATRLLPISWGNVMQMFYSDVLDVKITSLEVKKCDFFDNQLLVLLNTYRTAAMQSKFTSTNETNTCK